MHTGQRAKNNTMCQCHMKDIVLDKVDKFNNIGVLFEKFDPYVLSDSYITQKGSKTYMMLGIIKRCILCFNVTD